MEFTNVVSSNIESYCYENGNLYIKFIKGGIYKYENVPDSVVSEFVNAESKGSYFSKNIKKSYNYSKV